MNLDDLEQTDNNYNDQGSSVPPGPYNYNHNFNNNYGPYNGGPYQQYQQYQEQPSSPSHVNYIITDLLFQVSLVALAFIVPYLFYLLKKLLKKLNLLTPRVLRVIDKIQHIFYRTTQTFSRLKVGKFTGNKIRGEKEVTSVITTEIVDGMQEEYVVEPNKEKQLKVEDINLDDLEKDKQ